MKRNNYSNPNSRQDSKKFRKKEEKEEKLRYPFSVSLLIKITGNTRKLLSINETLNPLIKEESAPRAAPTHPREIIPSLSLSQRQTNKRSGKAEKKEGERKKKKTYKNSLGGGYLLSSNLPERNLISLSCRVVLIFARHRESL